MALVLKISSRPDPCLVGWLHFYDHDGLLLTEAQCSDRAHSAALPIRFFDFSEYEGTWSTSFQQHFEIAFSVNLVLLYAKRFA